MPKPDFSRMKPAQLARHLGLNESSIARGHSVGRLVLSDDGTIDLFNATNYMYVVRRTMAKREKRPLCRAKAASLLKQIDKASDRPIFGKTEDDDDHVPAVADIPVPASEQGRALREEAAKAELETVVIRRDREKEKLTQETLATMEQKKELAPLALVTWAFSFNDRLFFEIFREIQYASPVMASHYMAGNALDAEKYLKLRVEGLIVQAEKDLREAIDKDGFDVRPFLRKALAAANEVYGKDALDRKNVV